MSLTATAGAGNFTPAPVGMHLATCVECIDLGTQADEYQGETKYNPKIMLRWELHNQTDDDGNPVLFHREYSNYLSEKANLRKDITSWFGKELTPEHIAKGFNTSKLIGCVCNPNIIHKISAKGRTYAIMAGITPLVDGQTGPQSITEFLTYDLDDPDLASFALIDEWIQNKIRKSPEWQAKFGEKPVHTDNGIEFGLPLSQPGPNQPVEPISEDSIPF